MNIDTIHHAMGTNFAMDTDSPQPWLRMLAEAGFSHVHWAHHWKGTVLYSKSDMNRYVCWLNKFGLMVNDN